MSIVKIEWIICGAVWAILVFGFIGISVFNRIRNRDKHGEQ